LKKYILTSLLTTLPFVSAFAECKCGRDDKCEEKPWHRYFYRHAAEQALDKIFRGERLTAKDVEMLKIYWEMLLVWQLEKDTSDFRDLYDK